MAITPWNSFAPLALPITNAGGTTVLPGRFGVVASASGGISIVGNYFQNFAGRTTQQPVYYDRYSLDSLGLNRSTLAPVFGASVASTNPVVVPDYGNQQGFRSLGGSTPNLQLGYWDTQNSDGTYKVYYSVYNATTGTATNPTIAFASLAFPSPPTSYAPVGNVGNVKLAGLSDGNAMFGAETQNATTETISLTLYNGTTSTLGMPFTAATFTDGLSHTWNIGQWGSNYGLTTVVYSGSGASQVANVRLTSISPAGAIGSSVTIPTALGSIDQISWSYSSTNSNYWVLTVDGADTSGTRVHNTYQVNAATGAINGTITQAYAGTVTQEAEVFGLGTGSGSWLTYWVDANGLTLETLPYNSSTNLPQIGQTYNIPAANGLANVTALGDGRVAATWRVVTATSDPNGAGDTGVEYTQIFDTRTTAVSGTPGIVSGVTTITDGTSHTVSVNEVAGTSFSDFITHATGNYYIVGAGGTDLYYMSAFVRSNVTLRRAGNRDLEITSPDGADFLQGFSTVTFADQTLNLASTSFGTLAPSDFSGIGTSSILFRRVSDGLAYLFTMNDSTVVNGATLSTQVSNNWQIKGVGDFDGNGSSDLLFFYNNAANAGDPLNGISYITLQNGTAAISGSSVVQQLGPEWSIQGVGDFDGDGKSDVLYRRSTDGALYLDAMNGAAVDFSKSGFTSVQIADPHWQIAAIADFNGDGHADILWRYDNPSNPSDGLNGVVYEWTMNGTNVTSQNLISSQPGSDHWQVAGTGDFDGNGTADILFRYENASNASDPLNGFTYLDFMNGTTVTSGAPTQWQIDNSWSVASIGDYNGDGHADILFQRASDGATYIWDMNGAATTSGNFTSMQSGPGWTVQNGALID